MMTTPQYVVIINGKVRFETDREGAALMFADGLPGAEIFCRSNRQPASKRRKPTFRVAVKVAGSDEIVALGGHVATDKFIDASSALASLELVLLPPAHSLNQFDGAVPAPRMGVSS